VRDYWRRVVLLVLALIGTEVGCWAAFAPRSFYNDFPGGGRHWVAADGLYNEHLVRDVGELNLALAVVTIVAVVTLAPVIVRTAAATWLVYSVPHLVYHLRHLHPYGSGEKVLVSGGLVIPIALALVALVLERPRRASSAKMETSTPTTRSSASSM
jgi:hypothetical protein